MLSVEEQELSARLRAELADVPATVGLADRALSRARRRRATRLIAAVSVAAAATVAVPFVLAGGSGDTADAPPFAEVAVDPWGPWLGGNVLHLGSTELSASEAVSLVAVPSGAVYVAETGAVVWVRGDGSTDTIGTEMNPNSQLASDPASGWVAWVQGDLADGPPDLVVYDTTAATEVARQMLAASGARSGFLTEGAYPVSLEDGVVHYADRDGDYRWDLSSDADPIRILSGPVHLVDERAGVRIVRRLDARVSSLYVDRTGTFAGYLELRGAYTGSLSPNGAYFSAPTGFEAPRLYDTRDGARLDTGLPADLAVTDAVPGADGTVTYAAVRLPDEQSGRDPFEDFVNPGAPADALVTCVIATAECSTVAEVGTNVVFATGWY